MKLNRLMDNDQLVEIVLVRELGDKCEQEDVFLMLMPLDFLKYDFTKRCLPASKTSFVYGPTLHNINNFGCGSS